MGTVMQKGRKNRETAQVVPVTDMGRIASGACFFASGGGGSIEIAGRMIRSIKNPVYMISPPQLADNDTLSVIADIGSPDAMMQGKGITAPLHAYDDLNEYWSGRGNPIQFILPVEMGAVSTLIPFIVASNRQGSVDGVVDADPCGRAVPKLSMTLLNSAMIPVSPFTLTSDDSSDPAVNKTNHFESFIWTNTVEEAENCARCAIGAPVYNQIAGLGCYTFQGRSINTSGQRAVISGTVGRARELGRYLESYAGPQRLVNDFLSKITPYSYAFVKNGKIIAKKETSGGFDVGTITILDEDTNSTWVISYMNESLYLEEIRSGNRILHAMGPDLVCCLRADGLAFSNADVRLSSGKQDGIIPIGAPVSLFGMACSGQVREDSRMVDGFLSVIKLMFDKLGRTDYPARYIPIERLNQ